MSPIRQRLNRRRFLQRTAGVGLSLAGLALLEGCDVAMPAAASDPPPETRTIRLTISPNIGICFAPQYLAEEFLKAEGFSDVQYYKTPINGAAGVAVTSGKADISMAAGSSEAILAVDAKEPMVMLAGIHGGCYELFGTDRIRTIGNLKGASVSAPARNSAHHLYTAAMLAYVGLDPNKDVNWIFLPPPVAVQQLAEGKVDAVVTGPPESQELREKKIGHVVVNMMMDKPWSQYFCCVAVTNRDFMQKNPVATKRALRALLKATDVCAQDPERAARFMADRYGTNYAYTLDAIRCVDYRMWRGTDPSDTLRFFGLRMRDVGFIKSGPDDIIARGTDWRYLNELKKEMAV